MDFLTFISELIKALAWPAVTGAALIVLRKELRMLLPFLRRLKAGPVEAEFERDVNQLKEMVDEPAEPVPPLSPDVMASKEFLFQLATLHPRSAILESWVRVEAAARAALTRRSTMPATVPNSS